MLGDKIATYRRNEGISQQQLADKLGVSRQTIVRWEKDINIPSEFELRKLSELLGVTTEALLSQKEAVDNSSTLPGIEEVVNDISYNVLEQKNILSEMSANLVSSEDIQLLKDTFELNQQQLEIQKAILRQKKIRNVILAVFLIIVIGLIGGFLWYLLSNGINPNRIYSDPPEVYTN